MPAHARAWRLLMTVAVATICESHDLNYPTPPNPFAKPGVPPPGGSPPIPGGQSIAQPGGAVPPPPMPPDAGSGLLPGGLDGDAAGGLLPGGDEALAGDAMKPPLPPGDPPGSGGDSGGGGGDSGGGGGGLLAADADALPSRIPSRDELGVGKGGGPRAAKRSALQFRPALCLAGLSAACLITRPREATLLTAIDAAHDAFGHLLDSELKAEPLELLDCGIACIGVHSGLVWLGMLGQWLPLLPASLDMLAAWKEMAGAPQLLLLALTLGYLLRKLLPRSIGDAHLSASPRSLSRPHSLVFAAFSPAGLVHWLHMVCVVLVIAAGSFDETIGRTRLLGLYAAAGLCSSLGCAISQLIFGRGRAPARSTASGAAMAMLLLRVAAMAETPVDLGAMAAPPLRLAAMHVLLDSFSNSAGSALGIEKLFAMAGAAALVAFAQQNVAELFKSAAAAGAETGWDLSAMASYVKAAL